MLYGSFVFKAYNGIVNSIFNASSDSFATLRASPHPHPHRYTPLISFPNTNKIEFFVYNYKTNNNTQNAQPEPNGASR